ncbi:MAG TPA: TIGR00730 family Rossman fold protein [Stellaceae bacterium]|nr:TIGR00730 family Rossman fold protein [Stellaceae bacterium]
MNITVFCSVQDVAERYTAAAREFATLVAHGGHTLVWGGSNYGTMRTIADAAQRAGGKIVGVSVEPIRSRARPNADEMIIAKDWPERRATLLARADAVAVLPGGLGTLDEITEVLEYKKQNIHNKPVVFLNADGFYDGLSMQFERMDDEGFFPRALSEYLFFATTPEEAMAYIEKMVAGPSLSPRAGRGRG